MQREKKMRMKRMRRRKMKKRRMKKKTKKIKTQTPWMKAWTMTLSRVVLLSLASHPRSLA